MTEKQVILSIKGEQYLQGMEPDVTELVTEGTLRQREEGFRFFYEETELTGMAGTVTEFAVDGDTVTLTRRGAVRSQMVFRLGEKNRSAYETPYGTMSVEICTTEIDSRLTEQGGSLSIRYTIAIGKQIAGENRCFIQIKEKK